MSKLAPNPGIMDIDPYVGGLHAVEGIEEVVVLASNEGPLGASPLAIEAYEREARRLHLYPDGAAEELRAAIGQRFGLKPTNIVCGAGSDEIISLLIMAYAGVGDEVLYSRHGFLMYPINAKSVGATPVAAPETNLTANVDELLSAVTERTKILFLANPNNPTGSYVSADELRRLREGLRDNILMVIDAAYAEYVSRKDYISGAELVEQYENVVMTRTFSKAFGLAAVRLGWAYCSTEVADVLNRVRNPFNVTAPAQATGIAAVGDLSHTDAAVAHNDEWLPKFTSELQNLGFEVAPSAGNFVLVRFDSTKIALSAYDYLLSRGVIARMMGGYGLPECLRFTIGLGSDLEKVIDDLSGYRESL